MSVFSLRTPVSGEPDNPFHISRILEILRAEITAATMSMTVSRAVITLNHLQFSLLFYFALVLMSAGRSIYIYMICVCVVSFVIACLPPGYFL